MAGACLVCRDKIATGSFDKTCKVRGNSATCSDGVPLSPLPLSLSSSPSQLWNAETGSCYHTFRGHTGEIICLTFDPQSTLVASGSIDGTARLWSVEHGNEKATLAVSV